MSNDDRSDTEMQQNETNPATAFLAVAALALALFVGVRAFTGDSPRVRSGAPAGAQQEQTQQQNQDNGQEEDAGQQTQQDTDEPAGAAGQGPAEGARTPGGVGQIKSPAQTVRGQATNWEYIPIPVNPVEMNDASIERGRELFIQNCIGCHGRLADGKGPVYLSLDPPPRNLTNVGWLKARPDGWLFLQIQNGVPGTAMPTWGTQMDEREIWHVINWIKNNAGVTRNSDIAEEVAVE